MCGVNGIFAYHYASNSVDRGELVRTRDHMAARGPDGYGEWVSGDEQVGFGHRRLAIIDLSDSGAQPMASADGSLVITFNGEIYNYRELRRDLEAKGYGFRSNSDTEVLLHLYALKGKEMVHDLRGMFAFAIWDASRRQLFLARDPLGIKPLYYADDGWTFRFASQVKALRAGGAIHSDIDPAGWVGFYLWGSVPEPFTTLKAVRSLPAGACVVVDRVGAHTPEIYHSVPEVYCTAERTRAEIADPQADFRASLLDSIRHHLVADVPIGLFLSGGIDSGAIAGLVRDAGLTDVRAITLAFDEFRDTHDDESKLAAEVAALYGLRHSTYVVTEAEFLADLPLIIQAMDQPSIDGVNSWFVSKAAASIGLKVALSGLGGDELLGGYPSFEDVPLWVSRTRVLSKIPGLGHLFRYAVSRNLASHLGWSPKAAGMLQYGGSYPGTYLLKRGLFMPWELEDFLHPEFVREGLSRLGSAGGAASVLNPLPRSPFARVAALETQLYMRNQLLRDGDWASMAHGLEVRFPLADATLLQNISPLTVANRVTNGKRALAEAPSQPLPSTIIGRGKTGFTTPIAMWQRKLLPLGNPKLELSRSQTWARQWAGYVAAEFGSPAGVPQKELH